jgi:iron complex outermembrane receptor protein
VFYKNLSVLGDEAFLQPNDTLSVAGFIFEEVQLTPVRLQLGVRVEYDALSIDSSNPELTSLTSPSQKNPEFLPVSGAVGAIYDFAQDWQLALNLAYSQRAPTAEELFARGPHDATFQFIIGDPNLDVEINRTVDLNLRKTAGHITGFISGFYTNYDGFIDFAPTGEIEDGLQVFIYTPKKATFYGGEGRVDFHLLPLSITKISEPADSKSVKNIITKGAETTEKNPNDLYLRIQADYVHAEDSTGEPLPRITPFRYGVSLNYESDHWTASIGGWRVDAQNRVAPFETTTPGYTFLNASIGYKFQWGRTYNYLYLVGTNLLNEEARDNLSFLKEVMPLPGRSAVVGLRTTF